MSTSLQETYGPETICFGCGPANERGLRIASYPGDGGVVVCTWSPEPHHQAFPGVVNGGILGTLLDCHSNWTAAWTLMREKGDDHPPVTVTADFHVKLKRPTPSNAPIDLEARVVESDGRRAVVEATLSSEGTICATCRGTFVAVEEGHPAYYRW